MSLARLLRTAGLDARVYRACPAGRVQAICQSQGRILLKAGNKRLKNGLSAHRLDGVGKWRWFEQVVCDFGIKRGDFGKRCPACNTLLLPTSKEAVSKRVPEQVLASYDEFTHCLGCGRVYWMGQQARELQGKVQRVLEASTGLCGQR